MSKPHVDEQRHGAMLALLEQRARLLELSQEAIDKAVRRAVAPTEALRAKAVSRRLLLDPEVVEPTTEGEAGQVSALDMAKADAPVPASVQSARLAALTPITIDATHQSVNHPHGELPAGSLSGRSLPLREVPHGAVPSAEVRPHQQPAVGEDSRSAAHGGNILLEPGRIISGYRIEKLIGQGGMGKVYRATQLSMNRKVAFKVLSSKRTHPRFRERFLREARAAGRLHHPNLIAVHDVGEAEGLMYYSMELVEGLTLMELIKRNGRVIESRALEMVRQVLEALHVAHSAGIIHRDIKPDNLMLTKAGTVKVADLGLALSDEVKEDAFVTQAGSMMGTPDYMAPEQGRDAHSVDARADLYGVGATLYHLVCGVVPFAGETPMEVVIKAASQPLLFPDPGPSTPLRTFITHLMAKKPADRPETAHEALRLIARLRRTRSDAEIQQMEGGGARVARLRGSWSRRLLVAAGCCVLAIGGLVVCNHMMWSSTLRQVEVFAHGHRSREAIATIDAYQAHAVLAVLQRQECDMLRSKMRRLWDDWAMPASTALFAMAKSAIQENRFGDAYEILIQRLDRDRRSPLVEFQRTDYLHQVEARFARLERTAHGHMPLLPEPLAAQSARLWSTCSVLTVAAFKSMPEQGVATLASHGDFIIKPLPFLDIPGEGPLGGEREFLMTVSVGLDAPPDPEHPEDSWSIELGVGTKLIMQHAGLSLALPHEIGELHPLGPLKQGTMQVRVATSRAGIHLRLPDSRTWIDVPGGSADRLAMHWSLGDGHTLQVRLRPALDQGQHSAVP